MCEKYPVYKNWLCCDVRCTMYIMSEKIISTFCPCSSSFSFEEAYPNNNKINQLACGNVPLQDGEETYNTFVNSCGSCTTDRYLS